MDGEKWLPCAERTWPLRIQGRPQLPVIRLGQVCFEQLQGAMLQAPLLPALHQGTALKGMTSQGAAPTEEELDGHFSRFLEYYSGNISAHSHPFEGAVEALDRLAELGALLAVCTNKKQDLSDQLLGELGLAPRFRAIVGADSVPIRKPDGGHVINTVIAAGGDPARAIMVGDSRTDERAARNAGLPFVFVPFGYEEETSDQIGPDVVLNHYSELVSCLADLVS